MSLPFHAAPATGQPADLRHSGDSSSDYGNRARQACRAPVLLNQGMLDTMAISIRNLFWACGWCFPLPLHTRDSFHNLTLSCGIIMENRAFMKGKVHRRSAVNHMKVFTLPPEGHPPVGNANAFDFRRCRTAGSRSRHRLVVAVTGPSGLTGDSEIIAQEQFLVLSPLSSHVTGMSLDLYSGIPLNTCIRW